ncbi:MULTISPECIES: LLM class flavin-dependent oxidoreductase [Pseudonocardia]|uniref:Phthiodiolone/phenolphthiodiolone dimycocerosates ketoreductase n=2 Tax=Pseudonocardia TaxID=1847 RepID=A0A1Y2N6Y0_PSEAH|nr:MULTISPECIES: LLM class flavin-dependent oxidoreductase [Pseudonocardia]OSY43220.1 Phthiodiolone/phenolphthiodiolone dimycocerosates ketoreductase [Pseudonocardia autotrophica]TDN71708.1 alkanesulfonate monooxygenase SsuD/methylene tetrahydromethanopterin reductase-like flavin-dependent oxidoreductase (luciferase family) [Pseudonocardia autotrophica]BBG02395.1 oxidoreductase [Pseudonocardia autotrophica]GEC23269.1 oxidoreductase [Pseudonocardia saturnea]
MTNRIGLLLGSTTPPEDIARLAREVEERGFGELWIPEDYFFLGGIAASAIALGATERIPVGIAVVSSMVRHPALLAMEAATLARAYPGRFKPGIGHGVPAWTAQMGLTVTSPMSALRETLTGVSALLAGEKVDDSGRVHTFNEVTLTHPPAQPPPLYTGVLGDKGIALTGELADGIVVSVLATPEYVRATRQKLDAAADAAGRSTRPEQVVLVAMNLTGDPARAAEVRAQITPVLAFYIAATGPCPLFASIGANDTIADMIARGGAETVAAEMPDEWIDAFSVTGGPDEARAGIQALLDAGADKVVVVPVVADNAEETLATVAGLVPDFSS